MPDAGIVTNLGVSGFSLWILWMVQKMHAQRMKEKDEEMAKERDDFMDRIDARDEAFRKLESDVRNNLATTLMENNNIMKQAILYLSKRTTNKS